VDVADLDRFLVRKLADWSPGDHPVTTVYLSVDGRTRPRRHDVALALDGLLRRVRDDAAELDEKARRSVEGDATAMAGHLSADFQRGSNRGLAMFSSTGAGLWEAVWVSRPFRDQAVIGPHPDLLQLEALIEVYESFCTVLVASEKARIFVAELGRIEERSELFDDVPGRHDQGGWSQARYRRHIDEHRQRHLKRVADALFAFWKRRRFDHLILGGPEEVVKEFESELHDYLRQLVRDRISLPLTATIDQVLERSLQLEEEIEARREHEMVQRVVAEAGAGRAATSGLGPTLSALREGRVGTLVVASDLRAPGHECPGCGALATSGGRCPSCGGAMREVDDVVEAAVALAFRTGARVETVTQGGGLEAMGGIGSLLRF
jgi:peptide chain release factor subunit 1